MPQSANDASQLYAVDLVARDIEVTASNAAEAQRYGLSDAIEFASQWNYAVADVAPASAPAVPGTTITAIRPTVEITSSRPAESEFTLQATFPTIVAATSMYEAGEAALRMATNHPPQLEAALANYRYQVCGAKLRPHLLQCLQSVAEAFNMNRMETQLDDRGGADITLTVTRPEGSVVAAVNLVERSETSPSGVKSFGIYYGLTIRDESGDVRRHVEPVDTADIWLNDRQLEVADIDWLDPKQMIREIAAVIRLVMDDAEACGENESVRN